MTNEHEELTIKFDNLQTSLNFVSSDNDELCKREVQFLQEQQVACDRVRNLRGLIEFYRERFVLCRKIEQQNKTLKQRFSEMEESFEESQAKLREFEKDRNFNNLIPSLMEEIQELKKNQGKGQINAVDIENQFSRFEKGLVQKMKGELETASTMKSTEEEELEEGNRVMAVELKRKKTEVDEWKNRYDEIQEKYQENCLNLGRMSEQLKFKESEIVKLKDSTASQSDKIKELIAAKEDLKR
jgi:chromosome segregation ATPase